MNWTLYAGVAALLFGAEFVYLRLAVRYKIIDKPNARSMHSRLTVRGGGLIFWLAALFVFVLSGFARPVFFAGLTFVAFVSFLDDIASVSSRLRFGVQLISVGLVLQQAGLWPEMGWWLVPGVVVACGVLNAYNFMDGINGLTAFYSLVLTGTLLVINQFFVPFTEPLLPVISFISLVVFSFFNARRKALCFAGDVGSVSMAFIVLFLIISLINESGWLTYSLLLTVYGIDSGLTILYRLGRGENIFRPHKLHLFQLLVNQLNWSHLRVAGLYASVQALINIFVLQLVQLDGQTQLIASLALIAVLTLAYSLIRNRLLSLTARPTTSSRA